MDSSNNILAGKQYLIKREQRFCLACEKIVQGRTDKKFCNEVCRNGFNNRLNAECNNLVRNINHVLIKNRRILESFFSTSDKAVTTTTNQLLHKGFAFKYFTHQDTNKKGNTYFFCYDYGYMMFENRCLLVKGREM